MKNQIHQLEAELEAKQQLLKAMKAEEKAQNKKLFSESQLARAYFHTLKFCTSPFKKLHQNAEELLRDPRGAYGMSLTKTAYTLLSKAREIKGEDRKMANKLCAVLMELEDHCERRPIHIPLEIVDSLKEEIERIRPQRDEAKLAEIKELVGEVVQA